MHFFGCVLCVYEERSQVAAEVAALLAVTEGATDKLKPWTLLAVSWHSHVSPIYFHANRYMYDPESIGDSATVCHGWRTSMSSVALIHLACSKIILDLHNTVYALPSTSMPAKHRTPFTTDPAMMHPPIHSSRSSMRTGKAPPYRRFYLPYSGQSRRSFSTTPCYFNIEKLWS